jgi:hypothetical protein
MADWHRYQDETAKLFHDLGCEVETDAELVGARGKHKVDVVARFSRFGLRQRWIAECKYWKRPVPKEKVLTFKGVVDDVGADRGIMVSEAGHQSGAIAIAKHTNVTLSSLKELRDGAKEEIFALALAELQRRTVRIKDFIFSLCRRERHEHGYFTTSFMPSVDVKLATHVGGVVSVMSMGVERAMLDAFPVPLHFLEDGNTLATAETLEDFVVSATQILDGFEGKLALLKQQANAAD